MSHTSNEEGEREGNREKETEREGNRDRKGEGEKEEKQIEQSSNIDSRPIAKYFDTEMNSD